MGDAIYRDYDADELWVQYNNRGAVTPEELAEVKDWQAAISQEIRGGPMKQVLDIQTGSRPRERTDLFLPDNPSGGPLHVFLHGGYWQWNDKEDFAFVAKGFVPAGVSVAIVEYTLCPEVTLSELVDEVRGAVAHLWRAADEHGYDRNNIQVSGHSAGGHLTAMMMATDWPGFADDLPERVVASGLPISGIYDIEPIRLTPLNDAVKLGEGDIAPNSPMFLKPATDASMTIVTGGAETEDFHRQAEDLGRSWAAAGAKTDLYTPPGENHFTVVPPIADQTSPLFAKAMDLMGR